MEPDSIETIWREVRANPSSSAKHVRPVFDLLAQAIIDGASEDTHDLCAILQDIAKSCPHACGDILHKLNLLTQYEVDLHAIHRLIPVYPALAKGNQTLIDKVASSFLRLADWNNRGVCDHFGEPLMEAIDDLLSADYDSRKSGTLLISEPLRINLYAYAHKTVSHDPCDITSLRVLAKLSEGSNVKTDQVMRLIESKVAPHDKAWAEAEEILKVAALLVSFEPNDMGARALGLAQHFINHPLLTDCSAETVRDSGLLDMIGLRVTNADTLGRMIDMASDLEQRLAKPTEPRSHRRTNNIVPFQPKAAGGP